MFYSTYMIYQYFWHGLKEHWPDPLLLRNYKLKLNDTFLPFFWLNVKLLVWDFYSRRNPETEYLTEYEICHILKAKPSQMYSYRTKSQQKPSHDTFHIESRPYPFIYRDPTPPLVTAVRKNSPLMGRNLKKYLAGHLPWEREGEERGRRGSTKTPGKKPS